MWLVGDSGSFVDGRLIGFSMVVSAVGMAAAVLFGNVRGELQPRIALAFVLVICAMIAYNKAGHSSGERALTPVQFDDRV
jgi:hypothetical protein